MTQTREKLTNFGKIPAIPTSCDCSWKSEVAEKNDKSMECSVEQKAETYLTNKRSNREADSKQNS
jgi:hypothetical protein